ncbi:MAG TPA: YqcC family protein, partial [Cellvibrio sp.]|nr:YqcC family protein [Cellvibrio sp.]
MTNIHIAVAEVLIDIEKELRELRLWDSEMISEEALASEQPFAVDTMTFPQW